MSAPATVYIYALVDPRDGEVRYIGQAVDPAKRFQHHLAPSTRRHKSHKNHWLNALVALDLQPALHILEQADEQTWQEAERRWIKYYRETGCRLTNTTAGGEGTPGGHWTLSAETRARMSAAFKGRSVSAETRRKLSEANSKPTGRRSWNAGRKLSDEHRRAISESGKGRPKSEEHKAKIAAAHRGKKCGHLSPERREAMSQALVKTLSMKEKARSDSQSGVRGVYFDARSGLWRASITSAGVRVWLGAFATLDEAARAVADARNALQQGATKEQQREIAARLRASTDNRSERGDVLRRYWSDDPRAEERRQRMRDAMTGRKMDPDIVEKVRHSHLGKKRSPEARENIRQGIIASRGASKKQGAPQGQLPLPDCP